MDSNCSDASRREESPPEESPQAPAPAGTPRVVPDEEALEILANSIAEHEIGEDDAYEQSYSKTSDVLPTPTPDNPPDNDEEMSDSLKQSLKSVEEALSITPLSRRSRAGSTRSANSTRSFSARRYSEGDLRKDMFRRALSQKVATSTRKRIEELENARKIELPPSPPPGFLLPSPDIQATSPSIASSTSSEPSTNNKTVWPWAKAEETASSEDKPKDIHTENNDNLPARRTLSMMSISSLANETVPQCRKEALRTATRLSREVRQLRVTNPDVDLDTVEDLCDAQSIKSDAFSVERPETVKSLSPFRLPRIPELSELSEDAVQYNSNVANKEQSTIQQEDKDGGQSSGVKLIKNKVHKMMKPWKNAVFGKPGIWLCSHCERYLDTLNPAEEDNDAIARMHQKLGIWPPFKRVPGEKMRQNACASCKRHEFTLLFEYFEADE